MGQPFLGSRVLGGVTLTPGETRLPFLLGVTQAADSGVADGYSMSSMVLIGGLLLTFAFTIAAAFFG